MKIAEVNDYMDKLLGNCRSNPESWIEWIIKQANITGGMEEFHSILDLLEPIGNDTVFAEHEAAHAVMNVATGLGARRCVLLNNGGYAGDPKSCSRIDDPPVRIVKRILMAVAGPVQDSIRSGVPARKCLVFSSAPAPASWKIGKITESDFESAMNMAAWLAPNPPTVESISNSIIDACIKYIEIPSVQNAVKSIAKILVKRGEASAKQVGEKCKGIPAVVCRELADHRIEVTIRL